MKLLFSLSAAILALPAMVGAANAYYFDAANGDDTRDGHSPQTAWKTLNKASAFALASGDALYLKRGSLFQGHLVLANARGSSDKPVLVDAYGDGALPIIDASATPPGIQASYCSFVEIQNLEITSDSSKASNSKGRPFGVQLTTSGTGAVQHIVLRNLFIHDIFGSTKGAGNGIQVDAEKESTLSDILIEGCRIERTARTGIDTLRGTNLRILNNQLKDIGGPGIQPKQCKGLLIRGNTVDHSGSGLDPRMHHRGSGAWTMLCTDVVVEHNKFMHAWGINDSCGFHLDIGNKNAVIQYNLSVHNAGGFVQVLGKNENCSYRYNISVNDGWRVKGQNEAINNGHILHTSGYTVKFGPIGPFRTYIYNNTIYVQKDNPAAVFSLADTTDGLLVANNIFHLLCPVKHVLINWDKIQAPAGSKIKNVIFTHNLYLEGGTFPKDLPVQDSAPISGDARFARAGGLEAADYIPANVALVKDKGIEIPKLPGDPVGLKIGLKVEKDFFGSPILGLPDLGAIELDGKR